MRNLYMSIKRLDTSGRSILCFVLVGCMKVEQDAAKRTLYWIVKYISRVAEFLRKFKNMSQVFVDIFCKLLVAEVYTYVFEAYLTDEILCSNCYSHLQYSHYENSV